MLLRRDSEFILKNIHWIDLVCFGIKWWKVSGDVPFRYPDTVTPLVVPRTDSRSFICVYL